MLKENKDRTADGTFIKSFRFPSSLESNEYILPQLNNRIGIDMFAANYRTKKSTSTSVSKQETTLFKEHHNII